MSQSSPVSETVDDIRSAALWFEQQIENAKQDQITGFAVGPVVRGERAWARHCALYEAQQVFLKALGTSVLAQTPAVTAALQECVEVLELVEHPRREDPDYGAEVAALGDRIGYGALMSSASASWRKFLVAKGMPLGSEFVAGPCQATITQALRMARAALSDTSDRGGK
jgi:hypothetical protein